MPVVKLAINCQLLFIVFSPKNHSRCFGTYGTCLMFVNKKKTSIQILVYCCFLLTPMIMTKGKSKSQPAIKLNSKELQWIDCFLCRTVFGVTTKWCMVVKQIFDTFETLKICEHKKSKNSWPGCCAWMKQKKIQQQIWIFNLKQRADFFNCFHSFAVLLQLFHYSSMLHSKQFQFLYWPWTAAAILAACFFGTKSLKQRNKDQQAARCNWSHGGTGQTTSYWHRHLFKVTLSNS